MLENIYSQDMYRALKAAGGLSSPAGAKATAARGDVDSAVAQIQAITDISDNPPIDELTQLPMNVPPEVLAAAETLKTHQGSVTGTGLVLDSLSAAISTRMSDPAGNLAVMGVASTIAQNMSEVEGGCGPLGAAFSVLTSTGNTDDIRELLGLLPLDDIEAFFVSVVGVVEELTQPEIDQLAALMDDIGTKIASMIGSSSTLQSMVSEAEAMWSDLYSSFEQAVQTSVLMSVLKNPCLQAAAEAMMPDDAKTVMNDYLNS